MGSNLPAAVNTAPARTDLCARSRRLGAEEVVVDQMTMLQRPPLLTLKPSVRFEKLGSKLEHVWSVGHLRRALNVAHSH